MRSTIYTGDILCSAKKISCIFQQEDSFFWRIAENGYLRFSEAFDSEAEAIDDLEMVKLEDEFLLKNPLFLAIDCDTNHIQRVSFELMEVCGVPFTKAIDDISISEFNLSFTAIQNIKNRLSSHLETVFELKIKDRAIQLNAVFKSVASRKLIILHGL